ncbi:MAG: M56 family metallopeptidase, partial [Hyphomonadaceae bacterium]|nr:M56 family metallopeptidase [Hyphomonadaceae bacterium]
MISTFISVALLIAVVLLARRRFARAFGAKAAYALWALPLIRLAMPPLPAWMSPRSWFTSPETAATAPARPVEAMAHQTLVAGPPVPNIKPDTAAAASPTTQLDSAATAVGAETGEPVASTLLSLNSLSLVLSLLGVMILLGAVAMIARQAWAQHTFARLIRHDSVPATGALARMATTVQRQVGLRRSIPVRTSLLCGAPLVTGILRPVILVPTWFETDYTPEEQQIALTHEAMHVKRGDLLALQLAHLVAAFQWMNPLARRAIEAFRADQEAACDADVLALKTTSPRNYGATLLKAIRQSRPHPTPAFTAALPLNHSIKDRFAMLQAETPTRPRKRLALALTLTAGAAAILATASTVSADEPDLEGGERGETIIIRSNMGDRQMVLLTNPMEEMELQMEQLHEGIEWPVPPTPPTPPIPPVPPIEMDFSVLEDLQIEVHGLERMAHIMEYVGDDDQHITVIDGTQIIELTENGSRIRIEIDEEMLENLEARIEAHAERVEIHAEKIEEEAERWAEQFEMEYEAHFEAFEEEMEAIELRIEAIVDSEDFESMVDAGTASIRELRDTCEEVDFAEVDIAVIESAAGDKAICVDGDKASLTDQDIMDAVMSDPNLSQAEKAA